MTAGPAWQVNPTTNAPMSDGAPDRKRLEWLIGELLRRRDAGQLTDAGLRVLERQLDLRQHRQHRRDRRRWHASYLAICSRRRAMNASSGHDRMPPATAALIEPSGSLSR